MDERKIEAALEAEVSGLDVSPELFTKIQAATKYTQRRGGGQRFRFSVPKWALGLAACIVAAVVVTNTWMATPTLAATMTLRPRDSAALLSTGNQGSTETVQLPVQVDSYSALYYRWSPNGRYLVYGMDGDLFVYDAKTGETRNLTNTPDRWELMPTWSPQSDRVAFVSRPLEPGEGKPTKPGAEAWVMQGCFCGSPAVIGLDGSGYQIVEQGLSANPPTWSPDGSKLAYELDGQVHVYDISKALATALNPTRLGLNAGYLGAPAWSPTRNELAVFFSADAHAPTREELAADKAATPKQGYAVVDLDRQQARTVYQWEAPFAPRPPALWSSDGDQLALLLKQELLVARPTGLIVVDREGRQKQVVAEDAYQAQWEPGGKRLAYISSDDPRNVRILSPENGRWVAHTLKAPDYLQGFAWQPSRLATDGQGNH